MSRWTYIKGCIELSSSPYEFKNLKHKKPQHMRNEDNDAEWDAYWKECYKKAYYPYPEEQFKITVPVLQETYNHNYYSKVEAFEYSLPRAKKYIDSAFKLLPQGEIGWRPAIKQDNYDYTTSASDVEYDCQKNAYKASILNLYKDTRYKYFSFKGIEKLLKLELLFIDRIDIINIGIKESIRDCSCKEMQEGLETFFEYLKENDIEVTGGYLEWEDGYDDCIYAWRYYSEFQTDNTVYKFLILDKKTNKIIHSKSYNYAIDNDGFIDFDADYEVVEEDFN